MSLKRQLFLASLLMLLIPWAGLKFVLELDSALRQQALQQLQERGQRMAELAGDLLLGQPVINTPDTLYVSRADNPINPDGYADDWPGYDDGDDQQNWQSANKLPVPGLAQLRWQAATDDRHLFLLVQMQNQAMQLYQQNHPDQPYDQFELVLRPPVTDVGQPVAAQRWTLRTSAPGQVHATREDQQPTTDFQVHGAWRDRASGWQLELQLPLPPRGSFLGFRVTQGDDTASNPGTGISPPPPLVQRDPALERALAGQLSDGQQVTVTEPAGWIVADTRYPDTEPDADFDELSPFQVVEQITLNALRALIRLYQPEPTPLAGVHHKLITGGLPENHLVQHRDGSTWLATEHTLFGDRSLVLQQSLDQLLTLSGSTLGSVLARSLLIILALTLVLLGYASWLSWRIARLQRLVSASVDEDGRILSQIPPARSHDELGQLQQHFGQMVERLQSYNRYLESFSRRLSHELKTPVAVVRSSLENLAHTDSEQERQQYLERASGATERLRRILNSMSEAARLEQSFDQADKEVFDLAGVAAEATAAYQQLDSDHRIHYQGPVADCPVLGSPEMLVQMLDKLVDNARDFTPDGGTIEVELQAQSDHYQLTVFNEGSRLPGNSGLDIFGAFVSQREGQSDGHLGQGLLIVRLIADYHGGHVDACNRRQGSIDGVCFRVIIPTTSVESRTLS
ncbi:ATP-binding protein [Marinobacter halophilus]|uniref:histidine kinase n=1 Tax=Marinobacter halophilus TaxID=1323740 RepID=A0A2T1KFK5_9GAMM|nr:ATP-binding protein [Marinobacter halophilus]PSF08914.1 histidine kinase [Marinobacter halophilus]GGC65050.1 proteobacterial dedicated sortase system histidine kinase [Marinobacter halophilus]